MHLEEGGPGTDSGNNPNITCNLIRSQCITLLICPSACISETIWSQYDYNPMWSCRQPRSTWSTYHVVATMEGATDRRLLLKHCIFYVTPQSVMGWLPLLLQQPTDHNRSISPLLQVVLRPHFLHTNGFFPSLYAVSSEQYSPLLAGWHEQTFHLASVSTYCFDRVNNQNSKVMKYLADLHHVYFMSNGRWDCIKSNLFWKYS